MLQGRARTSFPVQSSHTDTKAKETRSPPCVQHLLHVAASPPRSCLFGPAAITHRERRGDFRERKTKNYGGIFGFVFVCKHLRARMQFGVCDRMDEQRLPAAYSCISPPPVTVNKDYSAPVLAGGLMNTQALCSA